MSRYFPDRVYFPGDDTENNHHYEPHWQNYRNDSGEQVPAFGCIKLASAEVVGTGDVPLIGTKPDIFGAQYNHGFNHPCAVGSGNRGNCTIGAPLMVGLYDESDGTPAAGSLWGPRDDTWKLKKNTPGFRVMAVTNTSRHLVLVRPVPFLSFRGVADVDIAADSSGAVSVWLSSAGSFIDSGESITAKAEVGSVDAGAIVFCEWLGDVDGNQWYITAAECPT